MASHQKVQNYLDRHKISALFEDLMARLVQNMPADPVPYLIKILQKFDEKAKKPFQENPLAPRPKALGVTPSKTTPRMRAKDPLSKSTTTLKKKDPLSKSTGHLSHSASALPREPSSPSATAPKGGSSASPVYSWQQHSPAGVFGVDRGYERPWIANMKKIKYEQAQQKEKCS